VTGVPEPTTVLIMPAQNPAANIASSSSTSTGFVVALATRAGDRWHRDAAGVVGGLVGRAFEVRRGPGPPVGGVGLGLTLGRRAARVGLGHLLQPRGRIRGRIRPFGVDDRARPLLLLGLLG